MKLVVQRVKEASVKVDEKIVGKIGRGYLVLLGVTHNDTKEIADYLVKKLCNLRIFEDENEKMNLNIKQVDGKILIVSQFTLYGNCKDGNRPSFDSAEEPEKAKSVYEKGIAILKNLGINVQCGIFGAHMEISYINDGPVTFVLDSACFSHRS